MNTSATLNKKVRIGLVLALILGVLDIIGLAMPTPDGDSDVAGPPFGILVFSAVMGLATIVFAILAWKKQSRNAVRAVVISRFFSALSAAPALFVSGVPGGVVVLVSVFIVITVVTIALVMSKPFTVPQTEGALSAHAA
jgi:Na+/proline symporter